jgi:hypothetical protein
MRKVQSVLLAMLFLALVSVGGNGDEPRKVSDLMRRKLEGSQKVLEGLALNDPKLIAKHAEELIEISKAAEWKAIKTARYELHSNDFRRTAETLVQNAKDKNLDGAALTYVELTLSCLRCHKYVREVRMTRLDREFDAGRPLRAE